MNSITQPDVNSREFSYSVSYERAPIKLSFYLLKS